VLSHLSDEWVAALDEALRQFSAPSEAPSPLTVQYDFDEGPAYHLVLDALGARARPGRAPAGADVGFTMSAEVAAALAAGRLATRAALLAGQVRVSGDASALLRWAEAFGEVEAAVATLHGRTTYPSAGPRPARGAT